MVKHPQIRGAAKKIFIKDQTNMVTIVPSLWPVSSWTNILCGGNIYVYIYSDWFS